MHQNNKIDKFRSIWIKTMWSNSILDEFPTYYTQYAIELLHTLGSKFDKIYFANENLRHVMIDFAKQDDQCFYQLALHAYQQLQINEFYDLMTVFNDQEFNAMKDSLKEAAESPVGDRERENLKCSFIIGKN
jgi:hypothetical protein